MCDYVVSHFHVETKPTIMQYDMCYTLNDGLLSVK